MIVSLEWLKFWVFSFLPWTVQGQRWTQKREASCTAGGCCSQQFPTILYNLIQMPKGVMRLSCRIFWGVFSHMFGPIGSFCIPFVLRPGARYRCPFEGQFVGHGRSITSSSSCCTSSGLGLVDPDPEVKSGKTEDPQAGIPFDFLGLENRLQIDANCIDNEGLYVRLFKCPDELSTINAS